MDILTFNFFHSFAGRSLALDNAIVFFADSYFFFVLFVFAIAAYWDYRKQHVGTAYLFAIAAAIIARFGVTSLIRFFIHRPRPFTEFHFIPLVQDAAYSFPSGHTVFLFAMATIMLFSNRKLALFLCASGLIVGIARIMAGIHYPTDIISGMVLGVAVSLLLRQLFFRQNRKIA